MATAGLVREFTGFRGFDCDDGYDYMEKIEGSNWRAVGGWGQDGWDLGSWPYVIYFFGTVDGLPAVREHCEGDLTTWVFETVEHRDAFVDEIAARGWRNQNWEDGRDGMAEALAATPAGEPLPERFRGPYSSRRVSS